MPVTAPPGPPSRRGPLNRRRLRTAAAVGAAGLLTAAALGVAVRLSRTFGRPLADFTRDVAAVLDGPAYAGFVSQITGLIWAAAAGAGVAGVLRGVGGGDRDRRRFAAGLGLLSAGLALDDALMLHEAWLPALGVPEKVVLLGHAALAAAVFYIGRKAARRSDLALLAFAAAGLGASVALDQVSGSAYWNLRTAAEDAAKLFGAACWAGYVLLAANGRGEAGA